MSGLIKICGLTEREGVEAALDHGADMLGFVFREDSPRFITFDAGSRLAQMAKTRARVVAVLADADDDFIEALVLKVKPDILQLHGMETPQRVAEISARSKTTINKTLGIASVSDFAALKPYEPLCERILLEAKMPDGRPYGGSGRSLDWKFLQNLPRRSHIMLAGGLTPDNVGEAIMTTGVGAVDVASGTESAPGIKDNEKVARFIANARAAYAATSVFA